VTIAARSVGGSTKKVASTAVTMDISGLNIDISQGLIESQPIVFYPSANEQASGILPFRDGGFRHGRSLAP
jgi:hypothetical protein